MTTPRMLGLTALFVAGTIVGAGAVALASSASSSIPRLVMGQLVLSEYELASDGAVTLTVDLFNTGRHDVSAIVSSVAGWPGPDAELAEYVLSARAWTQIDVNVVPDCDAQPTDVVELEIDTNRLVVPLEAALLDQVRFIRDDHCGLNRNLFLEGEVDSAVLDDGSLRMDLRLPGHNRPPIGSLHVTGAQAPLAGRVIEVTGTPAELTADESTVLTTQWTIDDCELALSALSEPGNFTLTTEEAFTLDIWLDDRGTALLARYTAAECAE